MAEHCPGYCPWRWAGIGVLLPWQHLFSFLEKFARLQGGVCKGGKREANGTATVVTLEKSRNRHASQTLEKVQNLF